MGGQGSLHRDKVVHIQGQTKIRGSRSGEMAMERINLNDTPFSQYMDGLAHFTHGRFATGSIEVMISMIRKVIRPSRHIKDANLQEETRFLHTTYASHPPTTPSFPIAAPKTGFLKKPLRRKDGIVITKHKRNAKSQDPILRKPMQKALISSKLPPSIDTSSFILPASIARPSASPLRLPSLHLPLAVRAEPLN